ncbi:hypothetical protein A9310_09960 [Gordonia sp. UCD-TK1]|nr:hypothetical protein A9310_09960 [Gordonia sp. UCD-TK1]
MRVDPDVLRSLANQSDDAASGVLTADLGGKAQRAADGVDGSSTQWAARLVAMELRSRAESISDSMTAIGGAVRGAGNTFEVEDATLARTFERLEFGPGRN